VAGIAASACFLIALSVWTKVSIETRRLVERFHAQSKALSSDAIFSCVQHYQVCWTNLQQTRNGFFWCFAVIFVTNFVFVVFVKGWGIFWNAVVLSWHLAELTMYAVAVGLICETTRWFEKFGTALNEAARRLQTPDNVEDKVVAQEVRVMVLLFLRRVDSQPLTGTLLGQPISYGTIAGHLCKAIGAKVLLYMLGF